MYNVLFLLLCSKQRRYEVPLAHISRCHVLDYEHQLLPIVLSHCQYALTLGKAQDVTYDYPALEKHILDLFIHGKPIITTLGHPSMEVQYYGMHTAENFAAVRRKVHPQVSS